MAEQAEHDQTQASGGNEISQRSHDETLICEALVREIRWATRWTAVCEAWVALLHVRRMAKHLNEEADNFARHALARGLVVDDPTDFGEQPRVRRT